MLTNLPTNFMFDAIARYAREEMLPPVVRVQRPRHAYENRYCNGCQCTTRHEAKDTSFACLRCGVLKFPARLATPALGAGVGVG